MKLSAFACFSTKNPDVGNTIEQAIDGSTFIVNHITILIFIKGWNFA